VKITTILSKEERKNKSGDKYLILKTNPDMIFVFPSYVPEDQWSKLEVGKDYLFKLRDGDYGKKLVSFNRALVFEINPKLNK
jgi:hypothetical protein